MITTTTTEHATTRSATVPVTRFIDDAFNRLSDGSAWTSAVHLELVRLASIASGALPAHVRPAWILGPDDATVVVLRGLRHLRTLAERTDAVVPAEPTASLAA